MKLKYLKFAALALVISTVNTSCSNDFVDTKFNQDVEQAPLKTAEEAHSFILGAYASMRGGAYYGRDFLAYGEIRSDEMFSNGNFGYYNTVANYTMTSSDSYATSTYNQMYAAVAKANVLINTDVNGITGGDSNKKQVQYYQGQAYAVRAQVFFDLLRLYGQKYSGGTLGVVLPLKYDPKANMARATITDTETQIEKDFNQALTIMQANNGFENPDAKTELSINAVKSLMTRYYLYKKDYAKVRSLVNDIASSYEVAGKSLFKLTYSKKLNGAAPNSIFELAVGVAAALSTDSYGYQLNFDGYGNVVVEDDTYASYTNDDIRKDLVLSDDYNYLNGKYSDLNGENNIKIIRIEEVLLNGIEAELNGGSAAKALQYYNSIIRERGLAEVTSVDMAMLKAERAKELLGEGFRQWDLLRWGDPIPGNTNRQLLAFPIPRSETDIAGTLVKSNPGYDN
ncbi:RagB/SusD family nutrient uptake outer membrane protein [Elizabethkingia meningoseptica]|uniref:RagB/SusD family nutrient uptake outer membrane protein n=1 Tax=Elizabethkingia meningoseptica TaxID=238 RepID=A0A1V3TVF1_ELIME|nr:MULTISPECIES: RagB/SusD family nutrient uptake outer membrane protein [Elizabethkingia]AQX04613.1 glycan metabolism protein [Elizabethkingia meningoseptica]AQX12075.1 glycan metabolism protein [Elizabethkingia meningoseptica]AQX46656.1 glycan metabolism protein [Elizabethkingia meningoseptica]EJK5328437.1 RagB/SusD family nutrient uptake outer membrane protein [Elizabethkingia meningoseptica]EOR31374.1 RagB/SusD domain-containing protein [Elizabethkingia meningoseptica ATCC 13253 = NBRC 125